MKTSVLVLAAFLAPPFMTSAQSSAPPSSGSTPALSAAAAAPSAPGLSDRAPRYRLRKSDAFDVQFVFSPELNQTVAVQPDGYITLKSVGTIAAEGLTIPELTERIAQAYSGILNKPTVTIDLKDFDKPYFVVAGQVGKPGKYDLRSDLTVTEGVALGGGFTEASKHSQVILFRPSDNGMTETHVINVKKMLTSHNLAEDIHLRPGDMIFVPQNRISKIQRYLPTTNLGMYGYPTTF
jgi:polysaccharide export outer membrane protein